MPRCCSVAGCKSNYRSQKESVSTFSLPKDEERTKKWLCRIPTDFTGVSKPVICIKHFHEHFIIRTEQFVVENELKTFERSYPKLTDDALPTIFPNLPARLSSSSSVPRRLCDAQQENMDKAIQESLLEFKKEQEKNEIRDTSDVIKHFDKLKNEMKRQWVSVNSGNKVVLCEIEFSDTLPYISGSACVDDDLRVTMSVNKLKVTASRVPKNVQFIKTKYSLEEAMKFIETAFADKDLKFPSVIDNVVNLLQDNVCALKYPQVPFLVEQLKRLNKNSNNVRYEGQTLFLAASIYMHSSSAYSALCKSCNLLLPHSRTLRRLIGQFNSNSCDIDGSIKYLKMKNTFLNE